MPEKSALLRRWWFELLLAVMGACLLLFVLAPLVGMIFATSVSELSQAAAEHAVIESIKVTLIAAILATVVSAIFGIPLAYLLARKRFFGRSLILAIVDLPIIIPHSAAGIALLMVVGRKSLIGRITGGGLVSTTAGISVAMAFVSLPFLVNAAREAFTSVPLRLERVARTLGASPQRVFFTISLPLAWRGILSGMILMWGRGISEFGAVLIIAYHPMTTPVMVYQRFTDYGLPAARAVAVLLIVICVAVFIALRLVSRLGASEGRDA
ncbi:MAG: ABC transporter permease [Phycisphaerae bacterium]|jgi:molybdate/tungstate transport system permease protein|nr:ABC transporter permease [Phycisphaerae bacterium]MDP7286402.1 ABC transporter permease [Phycisphaerae bacterium]